MDRKAAQRLCHRAGLSTSQNAKPGKHLAYDHPSLQRVRDWIHEQSTSGHFHERLIGNYDQVWSVLFRPASATLQQKTKGPAETDQRGQ